MIISRGQVHAADRAATRRVVLGVYCICFLFFRLVYVFVMQVERRVN